MSTLRLMDGYVRVSRVNDRKGETFISPSVQREQIEGWARFRSVEIAEVHEDLDQSGGKLHRPGLDRLLARIESHETEGVVVAKLDRLSRLGVLDALKLIQQIHDAGGSLTAVDLGIDPTTPAGELMLTMMLAMGRWERRRLADSWAIAQARAIKRGAKTSQTNYGYQRADDGTLSPSPAAPLIQRAYEIAGASGVTAATRYLQGNAPGRFWTTATVRRILARRVYLGEAQHGEHINLTAHQPLVTRQVWEAAQHPPRGRDPSGSYPLSGIPLCDTCGASMVAGPRGGRTAKRLYRCSAAQTLHRGANCPKPASLVAERLEAHLREQIAPLCSGIALESPEVSEDRSVAEKALLDAEAELEAFASDLTMRRALGDAYHANLALRSDARDLALERYRELARRSQTLGVLSAEEVVDDPVSFARALGRMSLSIRVRPGQGTLSERILVVPDREPTSGE